jgi:hypothetical protein
MIRRTLPALIALALPAASCTSSEPGFEAKSPGVQAVRRADGTVDDRSMCEWRGKSDREASETAGPGAIQPNVRRVWQVVGTGDDRHKVLVCREIDTNFDGVKDVVRHYNDRRACTRGRRELRRRIDTRITFAKTLAAIRVDTNHDAADGDAMVASSRASGVRTATARPTSGRSARTARADGRRHRRRKRRSLEPITTSRRETPSAEGGGGGEAAPPRSRREANGDEDAAEPAKDADAPRGRGCRGAATKDKDAPK